MRELREFVHGRSGHRQTHVIIGIIPYRANDFSWLKEQVTPDRVGEFLGRRVAGRVRRELLPNLPGMIFLCEEVLPEGTPSRLKIDPQGKTYYQILSPMPVSPPET